MKITRQKVKAVTNYVLLYDDYYAMSNQPILPPAGKYECYCVYIQVNCSIFTCYLTIRTIAYFSFFTYRM